MERRLAAILAADVVGYSTLLNEDEAGTLAALRTHRADVFDPAVAAHRGRVFKLVGDGALIEFPSVIEAVTAALAIQRRSAEEGGPIRLRIGINLGDVIADGDDLYGEGVNVATRLEALAEPGGICISTLVRDSIGNRLDAGFADMGAHELKGLPQPIRVWQWTGDGRVPPGRPALALPEKPSIAVLAFQNMSADPEQEYLADGIAEDVITALSRFRSLFVIARNSSFTYKGAAVDITRVARELGVRYVVEGSVRSAGDRVRITAQLIEGTSGAHLWADRFDGSLDDVFDLQDQITEQIVVAVEPEVGARERELARRKPPDSLDAWALVQRGLSHAYRVSKADQAEAIRLFTEATVLDPEFAAAHAHLANALRPSNAMSLGSIEIAAEAESAARAAAERAVSLDPNEPAARYALGRLHIYAGEVEAAIGEMQTAIAINPNFAWGHYGLALAYFYAGGQAEQAMPHHDAALRLSPRDPMRWTILLNKGAVLAFLGRHGEAIAHCRQACQFPDSGVMPLVILAATLAKAGQSDEARATAQKAMRIQPALSVGFFRKRLPGMHMIPLESMLANLRIAGIRA